jgi:hypothetical protein
MHPHHTNPPAAVSTQTGDTVAVKVIDFAGGKAALARATRESNEVTRANHRCCVRLVEHYIGMSPPSSAQASPTYRSRG